MGEQEIVKAYRDLYKGTLKAVRYSKPARFTARNIIAEAFRRRPQRDFNPSQIKNTLEFLKRAETFRGYEHRILRGLLHARWWQDHRSEKGLLTKVNDNFARDMREQTKAQYSATLAMFNASMGTCLAI